MGKDVICSKGIAIKTADNIIKSIQSIKREDPDSIRKIHLVIATSVPMAFCLAYKLLEPNYLPAIVIYHYNNQAKIKRQWGIEFANNAYKIVFK